MKTHVEGVISNFTVICSSLQMVHFENSFSDCVADPYQAYRLQCQERQRLLCIHKRARAHTCTLARMHTHTHTYVDTLAHVELKCHYLAGMEELNNTEETGKKRKRETKMVLNSFIIQMNENHINASRQGRASVSKLAHQLREETNEGRGSVWR